MERTYIENKVHELYYNEDMNCARTTMICLSELLHVPVEPQTMVAALGMHGAGGYRAQCGLVEGALMYIALYLHEKGRSEAEIVDACYRYAKEFETRFGSLRCRELRPGGFLKTDPPHLCEKLTCDTIEFAYRKIRKEEKTV